jgi:hypothetical protein
VFWSKSHKNSEYCQDECENFNLLYSRSFIILNSCVASKTPSIFLKISSLKLIILNPLIITFFLLQLLENLSLFVNYNNQFFERQNQRYSYLLNIGV